MLQRLGGCCFLFWASASQSVAVMVGIYVRVTRGRPKRACNSSARSTERRPHAAEKDFVSKDATLTGPEYAQSAEIG